MTNLEQMGLDIVEVGVKHQVEIGLGTNSSLFITSQMYGVFAQSTSPSLSLQSSLFVSLARLIISNFTVQVFEGIFSGGKVHLALFLWKNSNEICHAFDPDDFLSSMAKLAAPLDLKDKTA